MEPGTDYIGVGVGAIVRDATDRLFLARRGPKTRNEVGMWEFPGGAVAYGELLKDAIVREIIEEYGMTIDVIDQLGAFDHILVGERQHWVSITYLARHVGGEASIREPSKCSEIGWFAADSLPAPLSMITLANLRLLYS